MPLIKPFIRWPWRRRRARRSRMITQLSLLAILAVVILTVHTIYKPPKLVVGYFQRRFPEVLFHVRTSKKMIALTIDDMPSEYTSEILEILRANDAHATFFVIGKQAVSQGDVLVDAVRRGHELGNHAMFDEPSISVESAALSQQITQVETIINDAYSSATMDRGQRLFRPGSGIFSRRILDIAKQHGLKVILGSIYPHDPFIKYWWANAWNILSSARPGAVIICHDRRSWTIPMLQKVIPVLKNRGYEIVTVSQLLDEVKEP